MLTNRSLAHASLVAVLTAAGIAASARQASAAPQTAGNIAVLRVGDAAQTLANTGNTVSIDQFTPAGTLVNSTPVPDSGAAAFVISGSATSEGALSRSADGLSLVFGGYAAARPYSSSLASSTSAAVNRAVGVVGPAGTFSIASISSTLHSANNIRGATAAGGNFYSVGGTGGVDSFPSTVVDSAVSANNRVANVFNGNLMFSTGSGTRGIYAFAGTPAVAATPSLLFATGAASSPYDFAVNPAGTTVYVADDSAAASGGGVQRWDLTGGVWALSYTLPTGSARGLAVDFSSPVAGVYATTTEATANRLVQIADTGPAALPVTLATAGSGQAFRGVEFTVPEPGTAALLPAIVGVLSARRRRRS